MPRAQRFTPNRIAELALPLFWRDGFDATSTDQLIHSTGVNRHALYAAFPDKRALLLASLDLYRRSVVDPAFEPVEQADSGLDAIAAYFDTQITAAEQAGLPGPGCLIGNLATSALSGNEAIAQAVRSHLDRLHAGFRRALVTAGASADQAESWAALLVVAAQGLWSVSRSTIDAADLRRPVNALLGLIRESISNV